MISCVISAWRARFICSVRSSIRVARVLRRVAHRGHPRAVLGCRRLQQRAEDRDLDVVGHQPLEDLLGVGLVVDQRAVLGLLARGVVVAGLRPLRPPPASSPAAAAAASRGGPPARSGRCSRCRRSRPGRPRRRRRRPSAARRSVRASAYDGRSVNPVKRSAGSMPRNDSDDAGRRPEAKYTGVRPSASCSRPAATPPRTMFELNAPARPRSPAISSRPTLSTCSCSARIGSRGTSPAASAACRVILRIAPAYGRSASIRCSARRSRAAATISIARVIFWMFLTDADAVANVALGGHRCSGDH